MTPREKILRDGLNSAKKELQFIEKDHCDDSHDHAAFCIIETIDKATKEADAVKDGPGENRILKDAIFLYAENVENRGDDYTVGEGLKLLLDAVQKGLDVQDVPSKEERAWLLETIQGCEEEIESQKKLKILTGSGQNIETFKRFLKTAMKLKKAWGMP